MDKGKEDLCDTPVDGEWDGWTEEGGEKTPCPGCGKPMSASAAVDCLKANHGFDMMAYCATARLDTYGAIKLINYLRSKTPFETVNATDVTPEVFADDAFLTPVIAADPLMCIDFCPDEDWEDDADAEGRTASNVSHATASTLTSTTTTQSTDKTGNPGSDKAHGDDDDADAVTSGKRVAAPDGSEGAALEENEDAYFDSYSYSGIHIEMIRDKTRTESYRNFILGNPGLFQDKVVLDVGCGTGILSMFAAQAGARHVYGVDNAAIIEKARGFVKENGFGDNITLIRGLMEKIELPEKVDVIVSEWMGYLLLYESMFDSVIYAREKWLNPGGIVIPDIATMYLCGVDDTHWKQEVGVWDDVYGLTMGSMKEEVLKVPAILGAEKAAVMTQPYVISDLNLSVARVEDQIFTSPFTLVCARTGPFAGFLSYFDCIFDNGGDVVVCLPTGPESRLTHWRQVLFHIPKPITLHKGDLVEGSISIARLEKNKRHLSIAFVYKVVRMDSSREDGGEDNQEEDAEKVLYFELS